MQKIRPIAIYLAGPIDDITVDDALGWRHQIAKDYAEVLFYSPIGPWLNARRSNASIIDVGNRRSLLTCHGTLANLSGVGYGFGTMREIEFATAHDRPVAIVTDGRINDATLMTHDIEVFMSTDEAMQRLLEKIGDDLRQPAMGPVGAIQLIAPRGNNPDEEEHDDHEG